MTEIPDEDYPVEPNAVDLLTTAVNQLAENVLRLEGTVRVLRRDLDDCIRKARDAESSAHRAVQMVRRGGW